MIKYLVEKKSDLNIINIYKESILHNLCKHQNILIDLIKYLVENKADPNLKNDSGKTPKELLEINEHFKLKKLSEREIMLSLFK